MELKIVAKNTANVEMNKAYAFNNEVFLVASITVRTTVEGIEGLHCYEAINHYSISLNYSTDFEKIKNGEVGEVHCDKPDIICISNIIFEDKEMQLDEIIANLTEKVKEHFKKLASGYKTVEYHYKGDEDYSFKHIVPTDYELKERENFVD